MTYAQALSRLTALCSRAEHCTADILDKLRRWGLTEKEQAALVAHLTEEQYIDDSRYARLFAQEKLRFNHWGKQKIRQALAVKQIAADTIAAALNALDDDEYAAILRDVLRQKSRQIKADNSRERRQKLVRHALSRGFAYDSICACLNDKEDDEDE